MADTFDPYHVWLGIPPEERPANQYRLLGLRDFEPNPDVITNALDQRRAHLRSVQAGKRGLLSQQLLNEVSAAGVCLLDPAKKDRYDEELRAKLTPAQPAAAPELPIIATSVPLARVVSTGKVPDATAATPGPTRPAANAPPSRQPIIVASPFTAPANTVSPAATAPARASRSALPQPLVLVAAMVGGLTLLFLLIAGVGGWMLFKGRQPSQAAGTPPAALPTVGSGLVPAPVTSRSAATGAPMLPPRLPPAANDQSPSQPPAVTASTQGTVSDSPRFALVFTGKESVEVPLPPDLTQPDADFTIEMWAQWDVYEPAGKLFGTGSLGLYSRAGTNGAFNRVSLVRGTLNSSRPGAIQGGRWVHLAVTQNAQATRLFIDGKLAVHSQVGPKIALRSPLLLGNLPPGLGPPVAQFSGLIRDLRVARGCRYASDFQPESRFGVDAQTAVLLDLNQPREWGPSIANLAGQTPPAILNGTRRLALTPQGEVAAELPDGTVDLLRAFNIDDHSLEQSGLASSSEAWAQTGTMTGRSRYLIPYRPPAEYDVEIELTRMEGGGGAFLGLEIAGQPAIVVMGAFPQFGRRSGIIFGPIKSDFSNAQTAAKLQPSHILFVSGVPQDVKLSVRQNGRNFQLTVAEGGHRPVPITGDFSVLACPPEFTIPTGHGISFGSIDAKIRFHKLILRPVNKDFSPEMLAAMAIAKRPKLPGAAPQNSPPAQPTTSPSAAMPSSIPVPAPAPQPAPSVAVTARLQVPTGEKLAVAVEEARKIYEPRFKQATKSAAKAALAKEIQTAAESTSSDPVARYALFDLARKVNVQAGEVQRAIALAKRLEQEYQIPPQEIVVATVEALDDATLTSEQRSEFVKTAADLADAALSADLYERADKVAAATAKSASRLRDVNLRKDITQRRAVIGRTLKEWNAIQPSFAKWKAGSADAAAKLAIGKFYCFALEDFARGRPLLAAGDDAILAAAAKSDLAANSGQERFAAADAWRQTEPKISDRDDRLAVQRRQKWLLQQSLGSLTDLERSKAVRRLEELKEVGQARLQPATVISSPVLVTDSRTPTLVIYNTHNRQYRDRGVERCEVILKKGNAVVTRIPNVPMNWQPDANVAMKFPLPTPINFDTVRIEIDQWRDMGAGLAEVQLLFNGRNLLFGRPVRASNKYEPETLGRWTPAMINDGIIDEDKDAREGEGYWLLPNNSPGWIEISL